MASIFDLTDENGNKAKEKESPEATEQPKNETNNNNPEGVKENETPEGATEQKPEENNEETPKVTLRERVIDLGRSEYPDDFGEGDFDDDRYESMVGRMMDDRAKDKTELGKLRESSKKLFSIFAEHPDTMQVFDNLKAGMSLKKALSDVYGREYLDSEPDSEEEKAYMKSREEKAEAEKKIAENLKVSEEDRKKFYEENKMSDEEIKAFEEAEDKFWDAYGNGRFDGDYYNIILNNINHERDMKNAEEQGRVNGRNEKIEEEKFGEKSDGIPTNEGGSGKSKREDTDKGDDFADDGARIFGGIAGRSKSIWE